MVRMACLRDCDAICEIERMNEWKREWKKEWILESEVMEEEVISENVSLSPQSEFGCLRGATE